MITNRIVIIEISSIKPIITIWNRFARYISFITILFVIRFQIVMMGLTLEISIITILFVIITIIFVIITIHLKSMTSDFFWTP